MIERLRQQLVLSVIAAITVWFALLPWSAFAQGWRDYLYPLVPLGLAVTVSAGLLRALTRFRPLVVALQLIVVVELVNLALLHTLRLRRDSLDQLSSLLSKADDIARAYQAPVPDSVTGLSPLLIVLGLAVFLAFDFLALTLRRPTAGGLLLLAVLTADASVLDRPIGWFPFLLTAVAFVALLGTIHESTMQTWATPGKDDAWSDSRGRWRISSRSSSMRIGLGAACLAIFVPLVLPTMGSGVLESLKTNGIGSGSGGLGLRSPLLDMKRNLDQGDDVPLVNVVSQEGMVPTYFRIAVLDNFTGDVWKQGPRNPEPLTSDSTVPGLSLAERANGVPSTFDIAPLKAYDGNTYPIPYPPGRTITTDQTLMVDTSTWEVTEANPNLQVSGNFLRFAMYRQAINEQKLADAPQAPASILAVDTQLPQRLPSWVKQIADQVTTGSTSDFDRAVRLQNWFRFGGGFSYSLKSSSGSGLSQLQRFLGTGPGSKTGYCEQFATAFTLLARTEGVPTRVVVGFLEPKSIGPETWQFSSHDLHAWPEVYFAGTGWVRFEPTPAARTGLPPSYTLGSPPPPLNSRPTLPAVTGKPSIEPTKNPSSSPTGAAGSGRQGGSSGGGSFPWFAYIPVLVLLGVAPRTLAWSLNRWRWQHATSTRSRAEAAWRQVNDVARDLGLTLTEAQTVRARLRFLTHHLAPIGHRPGDRVRTPDPEAMDRLARLAAAVEVARYAPHHEPGDVTAEDVSVCVDALRRASGDRRRRRATWLPRAVFTPGAQPSG